jgi:hypothetical protein
MASPRLPPIARLRPDVPPRVAHSLAIGLAPNADDRHIAAADFARIIEESIDLRAARQACVELLAWVRGAERPGPASVARLAAQQADTDETAAFASNSAVAAPVMPPAPAPPPPVTQRMQTTPWPIPSDAPVSHTARPRAAAPRSQVPWVTAAMLGVVVLGSAAAWVGVRARMLRWPARASSSAGVAASVSTTATASAAVTATETETGNGTATESASSSAGAQGTTAGADAGRTKGTIVTGSTAEHHRLFVDGRVVGEGEGAFVVPCGAHVVRIGSAGQDRPVVVPCGGIADLR